MAVKATKKETKDVAGKKTASSKEASAPKKAETAKKTEETKKSAPAKGAMYHVSKRASDNKWCIFIAGSSKVIKTFTTKVEAEAYAKQLSANQGRTAVFHASKGANKGKIRKG